MCWPSLEGSIQIEERPRKHKNEPRRKRLHFVREHGSSRSDEWDLIKRPRSRQQNLEMQMQSQQQWQQQWQRDPRWLDPNFQEHMARLHQQQQMPTYGQPIPISPHHGQLPMAFRGHEHRLTHGAHHDAGDESVRREELVPHDEQHHPRPHYIEREPRDVARMPSHLRPRSRSRPRGHSHHGSNSHSLFSDDSSYGGSRGGRRRRESFYSDDDSFENLRPEPRRRIDGNPRGRRIR